MSDCWLSSSYRRSRGQGSEGEVWQLLHSLSTGRGHGPDRVLRELLVLDVLVYTTGLADSLRIRFYRPLPSSLSPPPLLPKPPPHRPHHSCQTGKTNQLWLLFPINHGIMQTGNSNKMQTSGKTGAPNQISHLHPAASLPDQTLLATPVTGAEVESVHLLPLTASD